MATELIIALAFEIFLVGFIVYDYNKWSYNKKGGKNGN